jgi:two-component system cell cycle sensor histidine kinase/response regulator CckA
MGDSLKLIIASDTEQDADIIIRALSEAGFNPSARCVWTPEELSNSIDEGAVDAAFICSGLSRFDPLAAIRRMHEAGLDIPLIFVSEPMGEERAIEVLKAGAHDIVYKGHMERLSAAIERELKEAKARSEHRRIERAVQTVANEWRTAVDTVRSPICLVDTAGKIVRCNKAFQRLSGKPFLEIVGVDHDKVLRDIDQFRDYSGLQSAAAAREGGIATARISGRTFEVQVEPVTDATGRLTGHVHVMNDITERLRAEEEAHRAEEFLAQAQKMEAVGQLAGGIAHDFNNILTGIMGYCSVLLSRLPAEDALRPFVSRIMSAAQRAAELTQGLLTFGRRQPFNPRPVDLNSLISGNREFMSRVIGEEIEIRLEPCPHALPVFADTVQIEQILLNLSTNARDAMPHGGVITVRTSADEPGTARPFGYLSFSDTGVGIEEETRKRVFEPFFTTKEIGKGTGLGLSVVWSIIEQHGGRISVESAVGKGTTFTIALPLMKAGAETEVAGKEAAGVGGTETILVVEDDDTVRDMARAVLEGFGYTVISAADGEEALKLFNENREAISLAILDIIMPKRDGMRMFEEMRTQNPSLRRLFISGYADDVLKSKGVDGGNSDFLRKPFSPLELAAKVREILDG